jgi:hypothetical protein
VVKLPAENKPLCAVLQFRRTLLQKGSAGKWLRMFFSEEKNQKTFDCWRWRHAARTG